MTEKQLNRARKYAEREIENFRTRYRLALGYIEQCRCSLKHADDTLYEEIISKMTEWVDCNLCDTDAESEEVQEQIYEYVEQYYL